MDIPGLATIYSIYTRNITLQNDKLKQRKECAQELLDNCKTWSKVLLETFEAAVVRWEKEGRGAAEREIFQQEQDFLKLEYWTLEETSPILKFLAEDERFQPFVRSCVGFYHSALSVKRLAFGQIEEHPGNFINSYDAGIRRVVAAWQGEVERMLRDVSREYMAVKILTPK